MRVAFVDFAYTFRTLGGAGDDNLLRSVTSLISVLERTVNSPPTKGSFQRSLYRIIAPVLLLVTLLLVAKRRR